MPRVTQYIRDEDLEAWNALENKSQWIHDHLNQQAAQKISVPIPKVIKAPEDVYRHMDFLDKSFSARKKK